MNMGSKSRQRCGAVSKRLGSGRILGIFRLAMSSVSVLLRMTKASNGLTRSKTEMRVAAEVHGPVKEPYLYSLRENTLGLQLRPGSMEMGHRRSALARVFFDAGELALCTPHSGKWIGSAS